MLEIGLPDMQAAWERVLHNEGCAGADGVTVASFEKQAQSWLPELLHDAESGVYYPLPLRLIVVEKKPGTGKKRELMVPAVRDRILQTAVARGLSRSWEEEFFEASYAYRPERGVDRAVARILQLRDRGWTHVLDADISAFFDNVRQPRLLDLVKGQAVGGWAEVVLRQWIKPEVWNGFAHERVKRGIPQGSPISPLLANLFLSPFDRKLEEGEKLAPVSSGDDLQTRDRLDRSGTGLRMETRPEVGNMPQWASAASRLRPTKSDDNVPPLRAVRLRLAEARRGQYCPPHAGSAATFSTVPHRAA